MRDCGGKHEERNGQKLGLGEEFKNENKAKKFLRKTVDIFAREC